MREGAISEKVIVGGRNREGREDIGRQVGRYTNQYGTTDDGSDATTEASVQNNRERLVHNDVGQE